MKLKLWIPAFAIGLLGIWVLFASIFRPPHKFSGTVLEPPMAVQDFTLKNFDGRDFRLSDQRGKIMLMFFGYTSCPDFCPTTLAQFRRIKESLGQQADSVRFVFVTADPERDTPERIGAYLSNFDRAFLGLYGSQAELQSVYDEFGIFVEKQDINSAAGYLVSHTTSVLLIDWDGNLRMTFPYGTETNAMSEDISQILNDRQQ